MLLWFVIGYWAISVAIGLIVALRVRNTVDYAAAGHRMPLAIAPGRGLAGRGEETLP